MIERHAFISILLLSISLRTAIAQELIWSDEFNDGNQISADYWSYDTGGGGWGNEELQTYSSDNVKVENGNLVISVTEAFENGQRTISSGRIRTQSKVEFLYGRIEARVQIPNPANGLWPCLWMLGANYDQVGWPKSGSMTMMQMGSAEALGSGEAASRVGAALHWEENGQANYEANSVDTQMDLTTDFHAYAMEWTPTAITMFVDGNQYMSKVTTSSACPACDEFHEPYFFIVNVAVGGGYMNIYDEAGITAPLPADLMVDYIRIYDNGFTKLSGSATTIPPASSPTGAPTQTSTKPPTTAPVATVSSPTSPAAAPETTPFPTTTPSGVSTKPPTLPTSTTSEPTTSSTSAPSEFPVTKDPPTTAPTTKEDSSTHSDLPVQNLQAAGVVMVLTNVQPLDQKAQLAWAETTEWHLQNEIYNSIGAENVSVKVAFVSQNPPYVETRALRGELELGAPRQSNQQQQEITFNADYAIQTDAQVTDVNRFIEGAFLSNYKKAIYLSELKGYASFQNVTSVSIEPATTVSSATGANTNNLRRNAKDVGLIVGLICAALVLLVLGLALYARRRRRRPSGPPVSSVTTSDRKEWAFERSGTMDDESLYTSHPKHKVAPNNNGSSHIRDGESDYSSELSSSLNNIEVDYNYREAFKNISKSIGSGLTPDSNLTSKEDLTVLDEFTVEAPKGKLGLILETSEEGFPTIRAVKSSSPLNGCVQVGDQLLSVDGRDVTMVMAETVSRVIASKENRENRMFVFARPVRK